MGAGTARGGFKEGEKEVGWPTGFEPATTSSTSLDSTIELWPPTDPDILFFPCGVVKSYRSSNAFKTFHLLTGVFDWTRTNASPNFIQPAPGGLPSGVPIEGTTYE